MIYNYPALAGISAATAPPKAFERPHRMTPTDRRRPGLDSEGSDMFGFDADGLRNLPKWGQVVYRIGLTATVVLMVLGGACFLIAKGSSTMDKLVDNQIAANTENTKALSALKPTMEALVGAISTVREVADSQRRDIERLNKIVESNTELMAATNKLTMSTAEAVLGQAAIHKQQTDLILSNGDILKKLQDCMVDMKKKPVPPTLPDGGE